MSVLIELTLVKSVNPDEVKELLIDFLKTSSHLFKSFNIRFLDVGGSDSFEDKLVNLTDASEDFGCTTCCLEDMEGPIVMNKHLVSGDPDGILFNGRTTNQESNSTFYMDCENHSNSIVKEETSTFVLKREPSMDVSSLQQFYTKTTSKRKSLLKELPFFTEQPELIQQNDVGTIKVTENCAMANTTNSDIRCDVSTNSKDEFTQPAELLEKSYAKELSLPEQPESFQQNDAIFEEAMETKEDLRLDNNNKDSSGPTGNLSYVRSTLEEFENDSEEANGTKEATLDKIENISNGAVEDSSFDRSSLEDYQNEPEEAENIEDLHDIEVDPPAQNARSLGDILSAAKRGDLTIDKRDEFEGFEADGIDDGLDDVEQELSGRVSKSKHAASRLHGITCSECTRTRNRFTSVEQIVTHLLGTHGKELSKPFRCAKCKFASSYRANVGQHLRNVHHLRDDNWKKKNCYKQEWHPATLRRIKELAEFYFPRCVERVERYLVQRVQFGLVDKKALAKEGIDIS
ncbi:unnamed protein product, partial [Mesorhabditis belari]|uniref:C2H2-type domain-containing protein n=1 Tax=Mesorhabditis belari TaxID=2138241 RepID=A0AAF3F4M0_9BILA